jgi:hypothetical protein
MNTRYWTVYWVDGRKQHIVGDTISDAFNAAGIGQGALRVVDFYTPGLDQAYGWNATEKKWLQITPATYTNLTEMTVMGQKFLDFHLHFLTGALSKEKIYFDQQQNGSFIVMSQDLEKIWNLKFD